MNNAWASMHTPQALCTLLLALLMPASAPLAAQPQVIRIGEDAGDGAALAPRDRDALIRRQGFALVEPAPAPPFSLRNTDGSFKRLSDYRGRWILLNFFATWCGPCESEMPSLQILSTRVRSSAYVVAIATDSNDDVAAYGRERSLSFPLLHDVDGSVRYAYGVRSYPTTFLVDPTGRVIAMTRGARDWRGASGLLNRLGH